MTPEEEVSHVVDEFESDNTAEEDWHVELAQSVEERVKEVRELYYMIQESLPEYTVEDGGSDTTRYLEEDGTIKKITASTTSYEHFENPYNAEYYYENNQAFFIFLYNGGEEHRIYLDKNDPMRCVRYIDADGMIYDYPAEEEGNENFLAEQYSVLAMQELHWAGI